MLYLKQPIVLLAFFATTAYCWLMFNILSTRTPRSFSEKLLFSLLPVGPFLQPVTVPLHGSSTLQCINHSSRFWIIYKPAEGAVCPIVWVINENGEQFWVQYWPLGYTINVWPLGGLCAAKHNSFSLVLSNSSLSTSLSIYLIYASSVCDWVSYGRLSFAKTKMKNIHFSPVIH